MLTGGGVVDIVTFQDPGLVCTAYLLPQYGILQSAGFSNQAIGFSHYIVEAVGNDDTLFIYGDAGDQVCTTTFWNVNMLTSLALLTGANFKRVYATGWAAMTPHNTAVRRRRNTNSNAHLFVSDECCEFILLRSF